MAGSKPSWLDVVVDVFHAFVTRWASSGWLEAPQAVATGTHEVESFQRPRLAAVTVAPGGTLLRSNWTSARHTSVPSAPIQGGVALASVSVSSSPSARTA